MVKVVKTGDGEVMDQNVVVKMMKMVKTVMDKSVAQGLTSLATRGGQRAK